MSPVLPRNGVMLASRIQVGSEPPTDRADLVLEGWAEGFSKCTPDAHDQQYLTVSATIYDVGEPFDGAHRGC